MSGHLRGIDLQMASRRACGQRLMAGKASVEDIEAVRLQLVHLIINELRNILRKFSKNFTKWIDRGRVRGIGSARRHDGGRPRDKASIEVLT